MQVRMWTFPKITALFGIAGALVATIVAFQMDNQYVSRTVLQLTQADGARPDAATVNQWLDGARQHVLSRGSLVDVIMNPSLDLYQSERRRWKISSVQWLAILKSTRWLLRLVAGSRTHLSSGSPIPIQPRRSVWQAIWWHA